MIPAPSSLCRGAAVEQLTGVRVCWTLVCLCRFSMSVWQQCPATHMRLWTLSVLFCLSTPVQHGEPVNNVALISCRPDQGRAPSSTRRARCLRGRRVHVHLRRHLRRRGAGAHVRARPLQSCLGPAAVMRQVGACSVLPHQLPHVPVRSGCMVSGFCCQLLALMALPVADMGGLYICFCQQSHRCKL